MHSRDRLTNEGLLRTSGYQVVCTSCRSIPRRWRLSIPLASVDISCSVSCSVGSADVPNLGLGGHGEEVDPRTADELSEEQVMLGGVTQLAWLPHRCPGCLVGGRRGELRDDGHRLVAGVSDQVRTGR